MSLSKPFPLQKLPRLAFENVLHQMYPFDLLELSNIPSENLLNSIKTAHLASHCDIDDRVERAVLSIKMKSGYTLKWCIVNVREFSKFERNRFRKETYRHCFLEGGPIVVVISDSLRLENYKCTSTDTIYSEAFITGSEPLEVPLFSQLLSKFPCPIRKLRMPSNPRKFIRKYIFNWRTVKQCQHLYMLCKKPNAFEDVLNVLKVTDKVTIRSFNYPSEDISYYPLKDYKELQLEFVHRFTGYALNKHSNHEHIELEYCHMQTEELIEFFKSWQNGKHRQLKTFSCYEGWTNLASISGELDRGLSKPKDSPQFVKCSRYVLKTTPKQSRFCHTILMKNCHGQLATLCQSFSQLLFAVWEEPFTEVKVPDGHRLKFYNGQSNHHIYYIKPSHGEVFGCSEDVEKDREGYQSALQFKYH